MSLISRGLASKFLITRGLSLLKQIKEIARKVKYILHLSRYEIYTSLNTVSLLLAAIKSEAEHRIATSFTSKTALEFRFLQESDNLLQVTSNTFSLYGISISSTNEFINDDNSFN
jgi:hypothetical protein